MSRVLIALNHRSCSGRAGGKREMVTRALERAGVDAELIDVSEVDRLRLANEATAAGYRAVVAAGGDGTVRSIASALAGSSMPMGVLPMGTINHFARWAGIPLELDGAAEVIASGRVAHHDAGEVNGRVFVNNATLGVYPQVIRRRDALCRSLGGAKWLAAAWAAARVLPTEPWPELEVELEGPAPALIEARSPLLFVGNIDHTLGSLRLCDRGALGEGQLGVCFATPPSRGSVAAMAARMLTGLPPRPGTLAIHSAPGLRIGSPRRSLVVSLDGEPFDLAPPLVVRARRRALLVLVPEGTELPSARQAGRPPPRHERLAPPAT